MFDNNVTPVLASNDKDSKQPEFDEMFEYDAQGRIVAQHRAKKMNENTGLMNIRPVANTATIRAKIGSSPSPTTWVERQPQTELCPPRITSSMIPRII